MFFGRETKENYRRGFAVCWPDLGVLCVLSVVLLFVLRRVANDPMIEVEQLPPMNAQPQSEPARSNDGIFPKPWPEIAVDFPELWDGVETVIGVITTLNRVHQRRQIRDTWGSSPTVRSRNSPNGTMAIVFVVGNPLELSNTNNAEKMVSRLKIEIQTHWDIVVLEDIESMNGGKTYNWLAYFATHFPKAKFVVKSDDDVFLRPLCLQRTLEKLPQQNLYWGRWTTDRWYRFTHIPIISAAKFLCEPYMQGGFIVMSADIARWIALETPIARNNRVGIEDMLIGCWLRLGARHVVSPLFNTKYLQLQIYGETMQPGSILALHTKSNWNKLHTIFALDHTEAGIPCPMDSAELPCLEFEEGRVTVPGPGSPFAGLQEVEDIFRRGCCGVNGTLCV